jgi:hypothetical protein
MDNRNAAFLLKSSQGLGEDYDDTPHLETAAQRIASRIASSRSGRVVFLIKGFNNSYADSDIDYAFLRQRIQDYNPAEDYTFVQIYWDALAKGPGTAPAPVAYWPDAMTYSNFAGNCGLRRLIRLLPAGTRATFVTHSRGAAVALAALADPEYDGHITRCGLPPLPDGSLAETYLVAFAPAIGNGHMRKNGAAAHDMYRNLERIYVGFNANDEVTSKTPLGIRIGPARRGDTRLAAGDRYFVELAGASNGRLQREVFHQRAHALTAYMSADQDRQTRCLLWAGRLIETRPQTCEVTR